MVIQGMSYPSDFEAKKAMIETADRLSKKGYLIGCDGSLSVRVGPNAVWITVAGADKEKLTQDMMVRVDMNGKQMINSGKKNLPDDLCAHMKVYNANPEIRSVIHAYPPRANVMGMKGEDIECADFTPQIRDMGSVATVRERNSDAIAQCAAMECKSKSGIVIANDGCVFWGKSVSETYYRLEAIEYYAKVKSLLKADEKKCDGSCKKRAEALETAVCIQREKTSDCSRNCNVCPVNGTSSCLHYEEKKMMPQENIRVVRVPDIQVKPKRKTPVSTDKIIRPEILVTEAKKETVMGEVIKRTRESILR
ncbi:MAG: class II aldolase/adducin family protein [Lachnospiraceae bacterium]|nr:class II aldolase/adducin family protein [Lachnospiraceae bacterium]